MRTSILLLSASAALLAACASSPAPREQMAVARSAVERASAAPSVTSNAPIELQSARDKLARAEKAMLARDYDQARRMTEQAGVDAQLAEAKAAAVRGENAIREVQNSS